MKEKVTFGLLTVLIFFLSETWFYPYSFLSINKSYSYNQDNVSGRYFLAEYKKAKQYVRSQEQDRVSKTVSYFYNDVDKTYVMEMGKQTIKQSDLASLFFKMKSHKREFQSLLIDPNVTISLETKYDLLFIITALDLIEDQLTDLTHPHFYTRQEIRTLIRNILVKIDSTCGIVDSFFNSYVNER